MEEEVPFERERLPSLALPPLPIEEHQSSQTESKDDAGGEKSKKEEGKMNEEGVIEEEALESEPRVENPMTLQDLLGGEAAKAAEKERSEAQKVQEAAMASIESENRKSTQATAEPAAVNQIDFSQYAHKAVSFLARNFYNLKYVALILAFCINFMLLFYKVTVFGEEGGDGSGDSELGSLDMSGSGVGIDLGSADGSGDGDGGKILISNQGQDTSTVYHFLHC